MRSGAVRQPLWRWLRSDRDQLGSEDGDHCDDTAGDDPGLRRVGACASDLVVQAHDLLSVIAQQVLWSGFGELGAELVEDPVALLSDDLG